RRRLRRRPPASGWSSGRSRARLRTRRRVRRSDRRARPARSAGAGAPCGRVTTVRERGPGRSTRTPATRSAPDPASQPSQPDRVTTIAKSGAVVNALPIQVRRHPTLADVAAAAGVSASTASRALRESPLVPERTRRRVSEAAHALGFEPNRIARSLRTRSSFAIGVVVPDVATVFWAAALKGAQDVLERAGYLVLVMSSEREPAREQAALRSLIAHRVDGILLATSGGYEPQARVPVVFFDRLDPKSGAVGVAPANREGMALLVCHLRGHGHTRIGYVGGHPGSTSADERLAAFVEAAGDERYVQHGDAGWSEESGERAVEVLLALAEPPTAVVAASDTLAVGVLRGVR